MLNEFFKLLYGLSLFIHQVPFIDQHHHPFPVAFNEVKNVHILCFYPDSGIYQKQTDIGMFNGSHRAHNRIKLQILFYLPFLPQSGCIYQEEIVIELVVPGMDRVSCGT